MGCVCNRPLILYSAKDKNARSYILPHKPSWYCDYLSTNKNTALCWWVDINNKKAGMGLIIRKRILGKYLFHKELVRTQFNIMGPDSSVGIATNYGLDGPGIESR
jgi:hypothetical protein